MILNRQRGVPVSLRNLQGFTASAGELLRLPPGSLTVCLVSSAEMARWNRDYRGVDGPTDVLSFQASGPRFGKAVAKRKRRAPRGYLGDIAIAPLIARRNAQRFGRDFEDEMCILILHGMLHLLGYDHETDSGEMDRRERRLRHALGLG